MNALENSLQEKQTEKQEIEKSIKDIKSRLSDLELSLDKVKKLDEVEVKSEKRMGLFASDRVILEREDFDGIKSLAKISEALRDENKSLRIENGRLKDSNNDLLIENKSLKIENEQVKKDKQELEKENAFLKKTLERVKELFRQKMPELANMIGYVKANILDKAKEKLLKRYFVDDAEIKGAQKFIVDKLEQEKQLPSREAKNQDYEMER